MFDFLLDLIFPRLCIGCGQAGRFFCLKCRKTIRFYSGQINPQYFNYEGLDGVFALAHYDGIIRQTIKEIKYRGKFAICQELAEMIIQNYHQKFLFNYLVPVPLSNKRQKDRGFNQAEKLAGYLKFAPVLNCLERTHDTKPQFGLKLNERRENVKNAFALKQKLPAGNFCLVDDVATTGATLSECAKVLKKAGAPKVYAICVARGG